VKRERQLARERYERQQARRQQKAARRKRNQQITAVVVALLLVVGGLVALSQLVGGDDGSTVATKDKADPGASASPSASPSPSPSATDAASGCTYSPSTDKAAKDVGVPTYDEAKAKAPFTATLVTDQGDITIDMAADKAPCTTNSFRHLATSKYFDGTSCHRLTTAGILVLQCGDPTGTGSGGPGYQFAEENLPKDAANNYPEGTVAMANAGAGTNGSQFFLVYGDTQLPASYTIFGTITEGLDVVKKVAEAGSDNANGDGDGKPKQPVTIKSVQIGKA